MLIAICEDTAQDMETILDLCELYANKHGYIIELSAYANADKLLAQPAVRKADIIILDIMMPSLEGGVHPAGVETARTLRADGYTGAIIFTTSSDAYYSEGFEVEATHYLLKPLQYEAVAAALDRAVRLVHQPERMITVPVNRIQVTFAQSIIQYAEVYGRETILYTTKEKVRVVLPLRRIEELLDGDPFLRCYRSYIINMDYVISLEEDHFVMKGNARIPISLRNRQALRERYFAYRLAKIEESGAK